MLSVSLRFTDYDYLFVIFKLFLETFASQYLVDITFLVFGRKGYLMMNHQIIDCSLQNLNLTFYSDATVNGIHINNTFSDTRK